MYIAGGLRQRPAFHGQQRHREEVGGVPDHLRRVGSPLSYEGAEGGLTKGGSALFFPPLRMVVHLFPPLVPSPSHQRAKNLERAMPAKCVLV